MQDRESGLRRIHLPRTWVNKGMKKGRGPLQKHCVRCGCGESHLGSNQISQVPVEPPLAEQNKKAQQSSAVKQVAPLLPQQVVPFSQDPLQHCSPAAQEPPGLRQVLHWRPVSPTNSSQILLQH